MNSGRRTRRVFINVCAALALGVAAGCSRATFVAPTDPGTPITDGAAAWTQASSGCRDVHTFVAGARASGKVGTERVWPVSLEVAVTDTDSIYIGATAAGNSIFVLAGSGGRAKLWLRQDQRVVSGTPAEIMEAVVGVALTPSQLLGMLSGCVVRTADAATAVRHGNLIELRAPEGRVFLIQVGGQWQVRALMADAYVVDLSRRAGRQPDDVWIRSSNKAAIDAALHLTISDGQANGPVPPGIFDLPAGATSASPMTLSELRAAGAWKDRIPSPWPAQ